MNANVQIAALPDIQALLEKTPKIILYGGVSILLIGGALLWWRSRSKKAAPV